MMKGFIGIDRVCDNVKRMKDRPDPADATVIDRYVASEGVSYPLGTIWRRPLLASGTATAPELEQMIARYGLEPRRG